MKAVLLRSSIKGTFRILNIFLEALCVRVRACACVYVCVCSDTEILAFLTSLAFAFLIKRTELNNSKCNPKNTQMKVKIK